MGEVYRARDTKLKLSSEEKKVLVSGGSSPRYPPNGHIVYGVASTLWAVGFDPERLETMNEPSPRRRRRHHKKPRRSEF